MVQLYAHNAKTYDNLINLFKTHNRVACVQPTGTGKSFIMLKLIEENPDKKFLIASPSLYIFEQIKAHAEGDYVDISNCEFCTYQKFLYMDFDSVKNIQADYIILDEFHRLGSAEWGDRCIENLLKTHENSKILGTSATPIRYLDSMRNMAEEIFSGCYAVNMNLAEAIRQKILPLPIYVTAWYSFSGEIAKIEKKMQAVENQYLKNKIYASIQKAKSKLTDTDCGLEKILEKHIENKNGKYIIFCPNAESVENAQSECRSWFKYVNENVNVYSVYTYGENVKKQFIGFKEDNSENSLKVLLCIDMLNEGVHIKGVDGVIMLRATSSANVFYQQLGRALSCSKSKPVIFDMVNNYETGDTAEVYESLMEVRKEYYLTGSDDNISFEIYDYVKDIRTLLNDIYNTFEQSWDITFEQLCGFVKEYGRFPDCHEDYKGYRLGSWCQNQRIMYNKSGLSDDRINVLESIGFAWTFEEEKWNRKYNFLKKFKEEKGHFPTYTELKKDKEMISVYTWLTLQRKKYKENLLFETQIFKLKEVGFEFDCITNEEIWENYYNDLRKVCLETKKFPVLGEIQDKRLRKWISTQRTLFHRNKLSEEQIQKLNELDFVWDVEEKIWNDSFEILKKFVSEKGRVPSANEKYCNLSLGQWYRKQLDNISRGSLSDERMEKFQSLGVKLTSYSDGEWIKSFEILKSFIADKGRLPYSGEQYGGIQIYSWICNQKNKLKDNKLDRKYLEMFKSINIDLLNFSASVYANEKWMIKFEQLKRFTDEYGRCPYAGETYEGSDLYGWIYRQQQKLKKNNLDEESIRKLKSLNIDLESFSLPLTANEVWLEHFEQLKRFINEYGRCPYSGETYEGFDLYSWIIKQKNRMKLGKADTSYLEKFRSINVDIINFSSYSDKKWAERFEQLKCFIDEYGHLPNDKELYNGVNLYAWLMKQKQRLKSGSLNDEYIKKFESININLLNFPTYSNDRWHQRFEQLKEFTKLYGRCPYSGEMYEGFDLYGWLSRQRRKLRDNKLDDRYLEKFKSINIDLLNLTAYKYKKSVPMA